MPQPRLTEAQLREVLTLHDTHGSTAYQHAGVPRNTFDSRLAKARDWQAGRYVPAPTVVAAPPKPLPTPIVIGPREDVPLTSYEQAWREFQRYIGQMRDHYQGPREPRSRSRKKVVIVGDLHVPFHDQRALAALLARDGDADLCIVNGDLQDFYSVSRFTKYQHIPFEEEAAQVAVVLEQLSQTFPRVLLVEGNHDKPRFERQLRDRLPEEMVKVVEFLAGGNLSVIAAIARRFPNVELAKHVVGQHTIGWFAQVGDLIVTHAEKFSRVPGSTLRGLEEWLDDMERTLALEPWRVVIQAHTHQLGIFPWHSDRLLVEGGCLCETHGYQLSAKIGGRPQRRGWVTLEQENGVTDFNSVRMTWWDAEQDRAA